MKPEEAKEICPDFTPRTFADGTTRCLHIYKDRKACMLPSHFICELVLHRDRNAPPKVEDPKKAPVFVLGTDRPVSVSRLTVLEKCPRLYQYTYVYKIRPPFEMRWKITGQAFTECRAAIDTGQPWTLDKYDLSGPERGRLSAVLRHYVIWRAANPEKLKCETKIEFIYRGIKFLGYIDAETEDGKRLYEWKYAMTEYETIDYVRQAAVYLYGRPEAEELVLAVANKPRHDLKKMKEVKAKPATKTKPAVEAVAASKETAEEFEERVFEELKDPTKYPFTFNAPLRRKDIDIEAVLDQMVNSWSLHDQFKALDFPPRYFKQNCEDCEFRGLCASHLAHGPGCDKESCNTKPMCGDIRRIKQFGVENASAFKKT
jgi:hypothetical protein